MASRVGWVGGGEHKSAAVGWTLAASRTGTWVECCPAGRTWSEQDANGSGIWCLTFWGLSFWLVGKTLLVGSDEGAGRVRRWATGVQTSGRRETPGQLGTQLQVASEPASRKGFSFAARTPEKGPGHWLVPG